MLIQGTVAAGAASFSQTPGTVVPIRSGNLGDLIVSECHGRFYEQNYRGNLYTGGMTLTALSATTIGTTAAATPILGLWNNTSGTVNLVVLQVALTIVANNLTSGAGPGGFVWASSLGNSGLTNGLAPLNTKTLSSTGSQAKYFTPATTLAGLTNNLTIFAGADMPSPSGLTYTTLASTALMPAYTGLLNIDGGLIVPPGGLLALLNTVSSTTFSVYGRIIWEEVAL